MLLMPAESLQNSLRRLLIQRLHDRAGTLGGLGPEEEVIVLGHQNPSHQQEAHLLPKPAQNLDEAGAKALAVEKPGAAIGGVGDELQLSGGKMATSGCHGDAVYAEVRSAQGQCLAVPGLRRAKLCGRRSRAGIAPLDCAEQSSAAWIRRALLCAIRREGIRREAIGKRRALLCAIQPAQSGEQIPSAGWVLLTTYDYFANLKGE